MEIFLYGPHAGGIVKLSGKIAEKAVLEVGL